jgi:hypothetical protein
MKRYILAIALLCAPAAYGQGYRYDNFVLKPLAAGGVTPVSGALITVCTSAGTGTPCTPKVTNIYSNEALTVALTGTGGAGTTNSDANGNYGFYLGSGSYVITITGTGITSATVNVTLPCPASGCALINKQITVGPGLTYTTIAAAIASSDCPAAGCTINVRPDVVLDTSIIPLNKTGVHINFDAGSYTYTGTGGLFTCSTQTPGIRISGANRGSTVGATQGTVINITNTAANFLSAANTQGCPGLELEHMSIIGPGSGTGVGLQLTGTRMKIADLLVASFGGNGATVDGSVNNTNLGVCFHSRFQGNGGVGMLLTGVNSDGWVFNSCDWAGNTGDGWVCDGTSKFSTFQGSNADSNVSGTGIHIKNCAQNVGDVFVDSATNNVVMDAASSSNWLRLIGGAPVTDAGSGNRTLGNTNLPLYGWNTLDMYTANFFGVTSGRVTLTPNAVVGGSFTATLPGATGTLAYNPPAATGTDLGSTALPWANLWLGGAATNNFKFQPAATAAARVITIADPLSPSTVGLPLTIASGTTTLTANAALAAVTSQAANTTAGTGILTTDTIEWSFATAPTAGDNLCHVLPYATAGNVNFVRTNPTAAAQNVSALVINWRVIR